MQCDGQLAVFVIEKYQIEKGLLLLHRDYTSPRSPALLQAKMSDPRSLLGAAAEVGPARAEVGTIL